MAELTAPTMTAPVGKIRSTGTAIVLTIITFGIYPLFWYFGVHSEMKRATNQGLGGGIALLLAIVVSIVMPFVTAAEVGNLYKAKGQPAPVSGITGLWILLPLLGSLIWFIKVNGALNAYWRAAA
jgi:cellobiose-specific phosphotransferase system component IIC